MKIAIIGTRGIPASYSGFETCVHETSINFAASGHQVRVYCRRGRVGNDITKLKGIDLVFLPFIKGKNIETFSHTLISVIHIFFNRVEVVQVYGAGNGWFIPLLRLFGIPVIFMIDGLDWHRAKWNRLAKIFLKYGGYIGARFAKYSVSDSKHVISILSSEFPNLKFVYIPYGANILGAADSEISGKLDVIKDDYFLFVGRFVPEKNVLLLVKAFEKAETKKKLVLIGGSAYTDDYEASIRKTSCDRIVFAGFIYGSEYEQILKRCFAYIQPSALEGTSPSLLAAMGAGAAVLVSDIPENREVVNSAGFYFKTNDGEDLTKMINWLDKNPDSVVLKRGKSIERVSKYFAWNVVSKSFLDLMAG